MGIIAHYRLDGDAEDAVGEYDADQVNNVGWVDGKLGQAGDFVRGSGNGIWIPHNEEISKKVFGVLTTLSFSFWIYPREYSNYGIIVGKQSGGSYSNSTSSVWINNGGIRFQLGTNEGGNPSGSSSSLTIAPSLNQWHHISCVSNKDTMKIYVDGELSTHGPITLTRPRSENTNDIQIGTPREYGRTEGVNALIDDVRIYDHALSQREVRDLSLGIFSGLALVTDTIDYVRMEEAINHGAYPGLVGYEFDGSSYVDTGVYPNDEAFGQDFTWCMWKKYTRFGSDMGSSGNGGSPRLYTQITNDDGSLRTAVGDSFWNSTTLGTELLNTWVHLAFVFDRGSVITFVNGEIKDTREGVTFSGTSSTTVKAGVGFQGERHHEGSISDMRIYLTALTDDQILELYQQRASIDSIGSLHTSFLKESPRARYIRDWVNGSDANTANHWVEIKAFDFEGNNVALGSNAFDAEGGSRPELTDGIIDDDQWRLLTDTAYMVVDLGEITELDIIKVWHYYSDGRTYYDTKTEISEDGVNWTSIFDSAVEGTYSESSSGKTHQVISPNHKGATYYGFRSPNVSEVGVIRGLVAWYPLIVDTKDYSDMNDAINNGTVATAQGRQFDGTGDYISAKIGNLPNAYTISMCVKIPTAKLQSISGFSDGIPTSRTHEKNFFTNSNGTLTFRAYDGSAKLVNSSTNVCDDSFHHICVTAKDNTHAIIYIDGTAEESVSVGSLYSGYTHGYFTLGIESEVQEYFSGAIRDSRIHNVALTPEEVAMQANIALNNNNTKTSMTKDCLYSNGQFKEVIA